MRPYRPAMKVEGNTLACRALTKVVNPLLPLSRCRARPEETTLAKMSRLSGGFGLRWWEAPGSLRTALLRLDGRVGVVVNAERHVVDPAVVSGEVAGQLGRLAQQMGLGTGDEGVGYPDKALVFEPVKPSFTREAGSSRRTGPAT